MSQYRKHVAYSKLGRIVIFDSSKWKMAGEAEATNLLYRLAERNPDVLWHVIGKSSGQPDSRYPNIQVYWTEDTPRSAWGVVPGGGAHMCNHCKTPVVEYTHRLSCCDRAKAATEYEDYLAEAATRFDAFVTHLGQHGTSHNFIPKVGRTWDDAAADAKVRPYVWAFNYGGYLIRALNTWADAYSGGSRRTVWLCADPRNYMNGRDVKWPTGLEREEPVLAQFDTTLNGVHERWQDPRSPAELGYFAQVEGGLWRVQHHYKHSGLDMQMLPDAWDEWPGGSFAEREPVGVVSTAAYLPRREFRRSAMIADWVLKTFPDARVYGKWDDRSLADVPAGTDIVANNPKAFPELLGSVRVTTILPPTPAGADGMKWCTAKPWQAFAARTVAFMVPPVDAQGWVLPAAEPCHGAHEVAPGLYSVRDDWTADDLHLARWLRQKNPDELAVCMKAASESPETWEWLVTAQHKLLTRRWALREVESKIEERLGLQ